MLDIRMVYTNYYFGRIFLFLAYFFITPLLRPVGRWVAGPGFSELVFAAVLIFEVAVRVYLSGCKGYFCGLDWGWNYFAARRKARGKTRGLEPAVGRQSAGRRFVLCSILRKVPEKTTLQTPRAVLGAKEAQSTLCG